MATDTLEIFGTEYTGVTGIKATDDNDNTKVYIRPQGTKQISANGTGIDVAAYATADVSVLPTLETKSKTYTPTTSQQTDSITASSGYDGLQKVDITINAVTSGSATGPSSVSSTGATASVPQVNMLTLSKSNVSITPVVSAGYVSSGTASSATVSLTAAVPTKGATTYTPGTTDQTIASGTYLSGTQTISGDSDLVASNIKKDVSIFGVTGSYEGSGGGGGGLGTLLTTYNVGTVSTSSTTEADLSKSFTVSGLNDYDALIIDIRTDTVTNGRHIGTTRFVWLTAGSTIETKNGATLASAVFNIKASSNGVQTTRTVTTASGIYPKSVSLNNGTGTIALYSKYNNSQTGTINGSYTARVYGIKLYTT